MFKASEPGLQPDEPQGEPNKLPFLFHNPIGVPDAGTLQELPRQKFSAIPAQRQGSGLFALPFDGEFAGRTLLLTIERETGLSIAQLAERMGITRQTLQKYLTKDRSPGLRWLCRVLAAAGGRLCVDFPPR
jgi:lambda repressor-like predicted transcriptional regulator